ncbi:MAG: hypothetical protein MPN21_02995 [Thermoanaerobaculia bacterium]|nr:hypothetical protein [Thermoanaerobaculia bacterium]
MKRILPTIGCLIAAIFFYHFGFLSGAVTLLVVGGLFELGFWILALRAVGKT